MKRSKWLKAAKTSDNNVLRKVYYFIDRVYSSVVRILKYHPFMDDREYIQRLYKKKLGSNINLNSPSGFNEKNNWRKLYDRQPQYTSMVDKYELKYVVEKKCGKGHSLELLGAWENPKDIDFEKLPRSFVLKPNHSGGVIVCRDKSSLNYQAVIDELRKCMRIDYYCRNREWPYKNVKRRVICEQYAGENLTDYKNYCFSGRCIYTLVWKNKSRKDGRKPTAYFCGMYDRNWIKTNMQLDYPSLNDDHCEKPICYEEMVRICEALSENIPFVRVDCFIINNNVYVGEMTFFPWGGFQKFCDDEWDARLGEIEILPIKTATKDSQIS